MALTPTADYSIPLADFSKYAVPVAWYEAVAVVQSFVNLLAARHAASMPALEDITLLADGTLQFASSTGSDNVSISALGRLLNSLLENATSPAPLRLFISQTTLTSPVYTSVEEFSRALAYFERPDRDGILRLLHQRTASYIETQKTIVGPIGVTPVVGRTMAQSVSRTALRIRAMVFAPLIAGAVVVFAVVYVLLQRPVGVGVSRAAARVQSAFGSTLAASRDVALSAMTELGLTTRSPAIAVSQIPESTSSKDGEPRKGRRDPASAASFLGTSGTNELNLTAADGVSAAPERLLMQPAAQLSSSTSVDIPGVMESAVYSSADPDVQPPALMRLSMASGPPDGLAADEIGEAELVINTNGQVETVKLLTSPGRYQERMNLSAVKAWKYYPAMKDGHPVKFRLRVKLNM